MSNELGKLRRGLRRSAAVVFSTRTLPSRDELSFDLRSLSGNSVSLISRLLSSMKLVVVFFLLYFFNFFLNLFHDYGMSASRELLGTLWIS